MTPSSFWTASEVCWPPLNKKFIGPWIIREGEGGGNRVSSTTANDCLTKKDIWKIGGTTDSRMAVMVRCKVRKTAILGRIENKVAGCAFISEYKGIAILQSLFVLPNYRRKGLAGFIISESVKWASYKESSYLALMTDKYNKEARGLYDSLGMTVIDNYHYRVK